MASMARGAGAPRSAAGGVGEAIAAGGPAESNRGAVEGMDKGISEKPGRTVVGPGGAVGEGRESIEGRTPGEITDEMTTTARHEVGRADPHHAVAAVLERIGEGHRRGVVPTG